MPQPERPVLVRAPAGDALLLQPELPNEERRYLQSRLHLPNAVARLERIEVGEVVRPRLEGVETLGERVVNLPLVPSSRPIAPLVGERLRLRRRRARRRGRRGGWDGGRRRGGSRSRGRRRSRRRSSRGIVARKRRRGCGRRGRRLRRERRRGGGRRRRGWLRRRRRALPLRNHIEDAYSGGGGEDGERQQDGASAPAAGRTASSSVRSVALPASCGRIACPAAGRIVAALIASGESRLEVFALPFVALPVLLPPLLLEAFALLLLAAFPFRLLALLLLKPLPLRLFPLLLLAALLLLPFRLLAAFAFRLPARGEERVRRHIARSGALRAARPFAVRVGVPPVPVAERAGSAVHEPDVVAPAAVADDMLGAEGAECRRTARPRSSRRRARGIQPRCSALARGCGRASATASAGTTCRIAGKSSDGRRRTLRLYRGSSPDPRCPSAGSIRGWARGHGSATSAGAALGVGNGE